MSPFYRLLDVLSRWRDHAKGRWTCLAVVVAGLLAAAARRKCPGCRGEEPVRLRRRKKRLRRAKYCPGPPTRRCSDSPLCKTAEAGEYAQAVTILQSLLAAGVEDGFVAPADGDATQTTLRREARCLLGAMPPRAAAITNYCSAVRRNRCSRRRSRTAIVRPWPGSPMNTSTPRPVTRP